MIGLFIGFIALVVLIGIIFHVSGGVAFAIAIVLGVVALVARFGTRTTAVGWGFKALCPACRKRVSPKATICPYCGTSLLRS